ncbi:hypothetical protein DH2020_032125 [Rehmannia glutinosa]|uniref:Reverse transcriptase domain-containing protein n=1 Tax=Rehmannia glutinosa TaxID=99300 RepID=A0ABR0VK13_REHGL
MECVSTTSYSLSINGDTYGLFKGQRGLRQGDPISPYIFVICLEYLSRLINKKTMNSHFNYHPKCGPLKITHLAFADDLMLLSRGDNTSIQILMDCLEDFGLKSGLHMNVLKSNIYMAGIGERDTKEILDFSQLVRETMPFRYLSVPLTAESFPLPDQVRKNVIKLCYNFLWGNKKACVAWKICCLPKHEGGLGLRDIKSWNHALLAKTLRNIHANKQTLWFQWIHHYYLRNKSIWYWTVDWDDSPLIKNILRIRDRLIDICGSQQSAEQKIECWSTCLLSKCTRL